jgi:hypothetical protein
VQERQLGWHGAQTGLVRPPHVPDRYSVLRHDDAFRHGRHTGDSVGEESAQKPLRYWFAGQVVKHVVHWRLDDTVQAVVWYWVLVQVVHAVQTGLEDPPQVPSKYWLVGHEVVQSEHTGVVVAVHEPVRNDPDEHDVVQGWQADAPVVDLKVPLVQALHTGFDVPPQVPLSCCPAPQDEVHAAQTRSATALGADTWYWVAVHTVQGEQIVLATPEHPPLA